MGDRIIANENMLNYFKGFFLCSPMHEITMSETHTGSAGSRGIGGLDGLPGTKGFPGSPGTHGPCNNSGTGKGRAGRAIYDARCGGGSSESRTAL